jgi:hypothetical protein
MKDNIIRTTTRNISSNNIIPIINGNNIIVCNIIRYISNQINKSNTIIRVLIYKIRIVSPSY